MNLEYPIGDKLTVSQEVTTGGYAVVLAYIV
jgi:hypothetical protein